MSEDEAGRSATDADRDVSSSPSPSPGRRRTHGRHLPADAEQVAERRRAKTVVIIVGVVALLIAGGGLGFQLWWTSRPPVLPPSPSAIQVSDVDAKLTLTPRRPLVLGNPDAKATITLYEDFRCPKCAVAQEKFGATVLDSLRAGESKLELYPMSYIDSGSARAANALACAAEQGFPMTYYQLLYLPENRSLGWSSSQLINLAKKARKGEVSDTFETCVTTTKYAGWVKSINVVAETGGLAKNPPTMLVDGQQVDLNTITAERLRLTISEAAKQ